MPWVSIGAAVIGGVLASDATSSAANTQAGATQAGIDENRRQYDTTRGDLAPYREAGARGLSQFESGINAPLNSDEVTSDPGYQFGLHQGQQALDRKIAAMGGRVSGAALKETARYATGAATTGYNAAYQRRQDRLNRLASLAGIGQSATNASAQAGSNSTNAITDLISSQGNASAAAGLARGNIWGSAGNQIGALYGRNAQSPSYSGGNPSAWVDPFSGAQYNNPSAYTAGG